MSPKIRILSENLANKIAAGEVVERPASVVKELVENALDALCREISVEVEAGGRRLIRVADDGCGMSRDDALLSLERHATSKISNDTDLFALSTLGFRGEALPSTASVSRLTLQTRERDRVEGTEIYAEGGRIREVKACGIAEGTVVSVRNLFFNTPARLKFMKTSETEVGHIGEVMTRLALSRPCIKFTYRNDGKTVFHAPSSDLKERVATLLGRSLAAAMFPVSFETEYVGVTGLAARPDQTRSSAAHLYTYINGRFIRDKVVQHAILEAYKNVSMRGRYPVVVLFITVPSNDVDVNVHPTKQEVRFRQQTIVHNCLVAAVETMLKSSPWLSAAPDVKKEENLTVVDRQSKNTRELPQRHVMSAQSQTVVSEQVSEYHAVSPGGLLETQEPTMRGYFSSLVVIGQYLGQYALCQDGQDLVIVDQHAAHERITFEKMRKDFNDDAVEAQNLLFPEPLDLSHKEVVAVKENLTKLKRLGFAIDDFGGNTWMLKAVPRLLENRDYVEILRDIIDELQQLGKTRLLNEIYEGILLRIACHSVIRGPQQLSLPEIMSLFTQLDKSDFSGHCPHGRPVVRRLLLSEVEKMFKRG